MWEWLKKRLHEASTWVGLSTVLTAGAILAKAPEVQPVAEAVGANADSLANGEYTAAAVAVVAALVGIAKREKGGE